MVVGEFEIGVISKWVSNSQVGFQIRKLNFEIISK